MEIDGAILGYGIWRLSPECTARWEKEFKNNPDDRIKGFKIIPSTVADMDKK